MARGPCTQAVARDRLAQVVDVLDGEQGEDLTSEHVAKRFAIGERQARRVLSDARREIRARDERQKNLARGIGAARIASARIGRAKEQPHV